MLKNKEDEFFGDSITRNVKYSDNEWQAHGTVDRGATYTKEPLLHLLFEGYNYDRDLGDYADYVPRDSVSSFDSNAYSAAKLQHDLYLLDNLYYNSSAIGCSINIFNVNTYLSKAISVANPIYDDKAKVRTIRLIDPDIVGDKTLLDILKYFIPEFYTSTDYKKTVGKVYGMSATATYDATYRLWPLIHRYIYNNTLCQPSDSSPDKLVTRKLFVDYSLDQILKLKLKDFLKELHTIIYKVDGKDKYLDDIFLDDFTLKIHDQESIKLPFNARDAAKSDINDYRFYLTRFIGNSISDALFETNSPISPNYVESTNELMEEMFFSEVEGDNNAYQFYSNGRVVKAELQTNAGLAADVLKKDHQYSHLYDMSNVARKTLHEQFLTTIDNVDTYISTLCPKVFIGYSEDNRPNESWGIHFINEEPTENLFQDTDKSYRIYNNVMLGYKLADALIATRTFVGGVAYLIYRNEYKTQAVANLEFDIPVDVPLDLRVKHDSLQAYMDTKDIYKSVTIINALYKAGHSTDINVAVPEVAKVVSNANATGLVDGFASNSSSHAYEFAPEIKEWLENECIIFKGQTYGDYVEELNFMQDLTPDSDVQFSNLRVKKTTIPYKRYQDSKYEVPYVEQTVPLLNNTPENKIGLGVFGTQALNGIGNRKGLEKDSDGNVTRNSLPPFIYDFDKDIQNDFISSFIDDRQKGLDGTILQRVNAKHGGLTIEDRITSPTIDELWTFLKYLTESDGSGTDKGVNERLPKFYGVKRSNVEDTISVQENSTVENRIKKNFLNPRVADQEHEAVLDILSWKPVAKADRRVHWDTEGGSSDPELQFGGYNITRYIEKIYDYKVMPFSRRTNIKDNAAYEFNTEVSEDFNNVTGYLEKLYNSAILNFDLAQVVKNASSSGTTAIVTPDIMEARILEDAKHIVSDPLSGEGLRSVDLFSTENDAKLGTNNVPVHNTVQRLKAFQDITNILNYHDAKGTGEDSSYHNHFKKYLENPKNLKEIERDLETIRQNLQTLAEFMVSSYPSMGYADRAKNRGTLHQLHKNAYDFLSTWLLEVNNTIAETEDNTQLVKLIELTDTLNNVRDSLVVEDMDRKVVFEDGDYRDRYLKENYDHWAIDLNSDVIQNSRARKNRMQRPNETLLSETYLAADGTWRSIHEHTVLPIIYDEH